MRTGAVLLFALLTSATTWAQILSGSGTAADPFLIQNDADWETFASMINGNDNSLYSDKFYKLTADITVSAIVGTNSNSYTFRGDFDGGGHTMTLAINSDGNNYIAPFRRVNGANISFLHIAGTVNAGSQVYASGLVGCSIGSVKVVNCWSSVAITGDRNRNYDTEVYHGGFLGKQDMGEAIFANCLFDGSISDPTSTVCGGLVGQHAPYYSISFSNCLMAGSLSLADLNGSEDFCCGTDYTDINNCYYVTKYGTGQGTAVAEMTGQQLKAALGGGWILSNNNAVPYMYCPLSGQGTPESPYLISSNDDWNTFAEFVSNGITFEGKVVKLTSDITVTEMAGSSDKKTFKGTFVGDGHTMTLNLTSTETYCAPFRYVDNATFNTLHVVGDITSSNKYAGGLIGRCSIYGTVTIDNCWCSVTITSSYNGYNQNGGFIGSCCSHCNINNCYFDGSLIGTSSYGNSGFVGYCIEGNDIKMSNCLFAPSEITCGTSSSYTFVYNGYYDSFVNNYYTRSYGSNQGTAVGSRTSSELRSALGSGWMLHNSQVVPILNARNMSTAVVKGIPEPYYVWTGSTIDLDLTVNDVCGVELVEGRDYTITTSQEVKNVGSYTLTLTGKSPYSGSKTVSFEVQRNLSGSGTADDPYMINDDSDWEAFVYWLNNLNDNYASKCYKLGADINVASMACDSYAHRFKGVFDGDGHTMTLNINLGGNNCGPFGYASEAHFRRINIVGSVTLSTYTAYAGGLVSNVNGSGDVSIDNCRSSVTFDLANARNTPFVGGFVGAASLATNITNCLFDGTINGSVAFHGAGFVSNCYNSSKVEIINCLFDPAQITADKDAVYSFVNSTSNLLIKNSYYTASVGHNQGQAVGDMTNAQLQENLGLGWTAANNRIVPVMDIWSIAAGTIVFKTYIPYTGSAIVIDPVVKDMDGNVIDKSNYDISVSPNTVQAVGNYIITVTGKGAYNGTKTHTFTVAPQLSGQGTKDNPYTISSTEEWNRFAQAVNGGYSYSEEYVQLTQDITVSTMVGVYGDCPFSGTFDGAGHILTADIVSTATDEDKNVQGVAPFHYICSATINNVTVAGNISSKSSYTGGLVGWAGNSSYSYPNHINDCVVTATITIGANYAGGLIGHVRPDESSNYYTYMNNCVFAGTVRSDSDVRRNNVGAMFGGGYANVYMKNCLENGSYTNIKSVSPRGASSYYNSYVESLYYVNTVNYSSSYITDSYGCHRVTASLQDAGIYKTVSVGNYTVYQPAVLSNMFDTYAYDNGQKINLGYKLKMSTSSMTEGSDYQTVIRKGNEALDPDDLKEEGSYTICFVAKDGNTAGYEGQITKTFRIMEGESLDGYVFVKDGDVYLINDESDLERLAAYVNSNTAHSASGLTFRLNADITMTSQHTPIGCSNNNTYAFRGTFDGNNKTISNLTINNPYANYQGLFGIIGVGAVIKDLTLNGCCITGKGNVGGIAGKCSDSSSGRALIQNCHVNGEILATSDDAYSHGGILGAANYVVITDCTVTGTISTIQSNDNYGGIIGQISSYSNVTSCENAASILGPGIYHGGIVGYENNYNTKITECFNNGIVEGSDCVGQISGYYNRDYNYIQCYYYSDSNIRGLGSEGRTVDANGAKKAFVITAGDNVSDIVVTESASYTSILTGKKYYTDGTWTLTIAVNETDKMFVKYNCQGGELSDLDVKDGTHQLTVSGKDVVLSAFMKSNTGIDIADADIAAIPDMRWRGNTAVEPDITVMYNGVQLVAETDYLLKYEDNTAVGKATVTVSGISGYKGTKAVNFNIVDFSLLDPTNSNSVDNPYLISTEEDLRVLSEIVNSGARSGGYYRQNGDITLTKEHVAIGTDAVSFTGVYDGFAKTISGLVINQSDRNYQGLFGKIGSATIKNVKLIGCSITGKDYVGGIVGYAGYNSNINDCYVSGEVKNIKDGAICLGGICGDTYGDIKRCVNVASVTGNNTGHYTAGIVGYPSGSSSIMNCFNDGIITGHSSVGSIIGNASGSLSDNYHTKTTTGGVGIQNSETGSDRSGAEVVVKITAAAGVTLVLPETPAYNWNDEDLYKSGTQVTLNYAVPDGKVFDCYSVSSGKISTPGVIDGKHVLTDFSEDVVISGTYADNRINLAAEGGAIASIENLTFNGKVQHPALVVTCNGQTLEENSNYIVTYTGDCVNAGQHTVSVTGTGRYEGTLTETFNIDELNISGDGSLEVTGIEAEYGFTGSAVTPVPTKVSCKTIYNSVLVLNQDYELSYSSDCMLPGNYDVIITGKGNYTGTMTVTFRILEDYALTVYDGTKISDYVPVYGTWTDGYQKTEFVIPSEELAAMSGKVINTMKFYLKSCASSSWTGTFKVFLKEVDFTTYAETDPAFSGMEDASIVYEGKLDGTKPVMTVSFNAPFIYNGGNLLIGFYETKKGNYSSSQFYGKTVSGACVGGYNSSALDEVSALHRNFMPKTTFLFKPDFALTESTDINNDLAQKMKGNSVKFERSFTENVASTICLPFGVTANQSWGKFYEFAGISRPGNANWTVTMQEHSTNDLTANTPYLFVPVSTGSIEFSGDVPDDFDGNPGSVSAVDNVYGGTWSFRGTYKGIQWNAGDADLGYVFGFASAGYDGGAYTVSPGDFVRASSGASIASFRAYLKFNAPQHAPARNGSVISTDRQMPSRLTVVLLGKDGGTTAVGTLDTTTGTFTFDEDAWYSIDGHKLENQPTVPGVYINGTRKVTIKY